MSVHAASFSSSAFRCVSTGLVAFRFSVFRSRICNHRMIAHPAVVARLNMILGAGFFECKITRNSNALHHFVAISAHFGERSLEFAQ